MAETKPAREPKALSTEYHKARKQLMLWAGILLIWELVGVDLTIAKDTGGNVGAIISSIKSPQAVPWVLLILVAYFLFKFTVEWYQCDAARRRLRVARIDFASAWVVSLMAYALYIGQAISHIQFADLLQGPNTGFSLFLGVIFGITIAVIVVRGDDLLLRYRLRLNLNWLEVVVIMLVLLVASMSLFILKARIRWSVLLASSLSLASPWIIAFVIGSTRGFLSRKDG